jgi:hypothetical protein
MGHERLFYKNNTPRQLMPAGSFGGCRELNAIKPEQSCIWDRIFTLIKLKSQPLIRYQLSKITANLTKESPEISNS